MWVWNAPESSNWDKGFRTDGVREVRREKRKERRETVKQEEGQPILWECATVVSVRHHGSSLQPRLSEVSWRTQLRNVFFCERKDQIPSTLSISQNEPPSLLISAHTHPMMWHPRVSKPKTWQIYHAVRLHGWKLIAVAPLKKKSESNGCSGQEMSYILFNSR